MILRYLMLLVVGIFPTCARLGAETSSPNILFLFADDLAFDCIHSYGNEVVQTPNLDRLAKRGTTFTHCYNMGAWGGAVCVASRTMLNTGHFIWRAHEELPDLKDKLQAEGQLWSQRMAAAGYDTYLTGKWHVKVDATEVFGTAANVRGGMPNQVDEGYDRPKGPDDKTWLPWDTKHGGFWKGGTHWSEVVADDAEDFMRTAEGRSNPFFMYIAFNAAHDPRQAPREFVEQYPPESIPVPQPFLEQYPYDLPMIKIRDEKLAPFPRTEYAVQVNRQEYYALITHMDGQIGRILDALEASGMADNTYTFFTADHGLAVGHHGLMGKQNMYDHSLRVPFLVAGPDVAAGEECTVPIYLQDVMPTTLELAGANTDGVDFKSLLPLLRGTAESSYDAIYGCYMESQRSITEDGYKLIVYPELDQKLLFDLGEDPLEEHNLADDPASAERVARLLDQLRTLQREMQDKLAL